jgi:hypothetical protein
METIPLSAFRLPRVVYLSNAPEGLVPPDDAFLSKEEVADS